MRVSCRIQKLKSSNLSGVQKHNEREFKVPNADAEKSHLNRRLIGAGNLSELVNNRIRGCKAKVIGSGKNTSNVAVEIILSASPEYFRDHPDEIGVYDENKMEAWVQRNEDFLKIKYGDNLVCLDLHLDEATPHLHAVITPLVHKEKSYRRTKEQIKNNIPPRKYEVFSLDSKTMFNRKALIELQTDAALAVRDLGISRGIRGSKSKHTTLKEFYSIMNQGVKPNTFAPSFIRTDEIGRFNLSGFVHDYNKRLENYFNRINNDIKHNVTISKGLTVRNESLTKSLDTYLSLGNADDIQQNLDLLARYQVVTIEQLDFLIDSYRDASDLKMKISDRDGRIVQQSDAIDDLRGEVKQLNEKLEMTKNLDQMVDRLIKVNTAAMEALLSAPKAYIDQLPDELKQAMYQFYNNNRAEFELRERGMNRSCNHDPDYNSPYF